MNPTKVPDAPTAVQSLIGDRKPHKLLKHFNINRRMIFEVKNTKEHELDELLEELILELNPFFNIRWTYNKPNLFIVKNRDMINRLRGKKTPNWVVGWSQGKDLFVLDKNSFEAESDHKYSTEEYKKLIKHELVHCFCNTLFPSFHNPLWLNEGIAVFLSDQYKTKAKPEKFKHFLDYYDNIGDHLYHESGFAIKCLINKYGEKKILKLIKKCGEIKSRDEFDLLFKKIYGFVPNYNSFDELLD